MHSLVIPTRNRPHTAEKLIVKLLSFVPPGNELIVQDCSNEPVLGERLSSVLSDPRLNYLHTNRRLSMTENWNLAIQRCRNPYISFIGDDDGISLDFYSAVEWMERNSIKAVVSGYPTSVYYWPDYYDDSAAGSCTTYSYSGTSRKVFVSEQLARAMHHFDGVYLLPKLYYGIVSKEYVERIRMNDGDCFRGQTPDHYSIYRLASVVDELTVVDYPLFLPGACGASNASIANSRAIDTFHNHLREYGVIDDWPSILPHPMTRSVVVHLAEALVRGVVDSGRPDLLRTLNLANIYVIAFRSDPGMARENLRRYIAACRTLKRSVVPEAVASLRAAAGYAREALARRLGNRLKGPNGRGDHDRRWVRNVPDIAVAMERLQEHLDSLDVTPPWAAKAA